MYTCLIADDQLIERDLLHMHLSKIRDLEIVGECSNGLEISQIISNQKIDIVFSDIQMPGLDGLSLLKSLKNPPVFIFVSSYSEFAAESFSLDVIDYIIKPVSFERIFQATNKAIEYLTIKEKRNNYDFSSLDNEEIAFSEETFIFIKDGQGYRKIEISDILFFESMGDFSKLHTAQNKKYVVLVNLKNIERQLSSKIFKRIHKQYVVNIKQVETIGVTEITFSNQQSIPFSNSYKQDLLESLVKKSLLKR